MLEQALFPLIIFCYVIVEAKFVFLSSIWKLEVLRNLIECFVEVKFMVVVTSSLQFLYFVPIKYTQGTSMKCIPYACGTFEMLINVAFPSLSEGLYFISCFKLIIVTSCFFYLTCSVFLITTIELSNKVLQ